MSIQEYECAVDGRLEVFLRSLDVPSSINCPDCGGSAPHVMSPLGRFDVQRGWDEKANDYRRNPYDQAKAQLTNLDRENQEHQDARPMRITEGMVQETAKQIDKTNRKPDDPHGMAVRRAAHQKAKANRKQT